MCDAYTCAMCGGTFKTGWSKEEAAAEAEKHYGKIPEQEKAIVCDDCYQKIHPEKFPLTTRFARARIMKGKQDERE